jgi:hypothetical protein
MPCLYRSAASALLYKLMPLLVQAKHAKIDPTVCTNASLECFATRPTATTLLPKVLYKDLIIQFSKSSATLFSME